MAIPVDPEVLERLRRGETISGTDPSGGFAFEVDPSRPYLLTAIHAGHAVPSELASRMAITEEGRRFEEDTATDEMVRGAPSAIWGLVSRAVVDLNRPEALALPLTPERFWGVRVYDRAPTEPMNRRSLELHAAFYRFVGSCVTALLERFKTCVVYDLHSYNISRQVERGFARPPVFNLGTALLDRTRWAGAIDAWLSLLGEIRIPGVETTAVENLVFEGKGEFCACLTNWDPRILVLPTEVAKVYMDEQTGVVDPDRVAALRDGLQTAAIRHAAASSPTGTGRGPGQRE
ncbi:MAG: N-formylglutamate amidohydrolase [Candidatus Latescibacterota bacterium]